MSSKIRKIVGWSTGLLLFGSSIWGSVAATKTFAASGITDDHPFTAAEAQLIHEGKIGYDDGSETGLVDLSLLKGAVMDPDGDDDFDGIPNKDELHVYTKNGQKYLHYLSHPKLKDTDGDGIPDKDDAKKLSWDVHAREGVIFQELTYCEDDYQVKVLGQDAIDGKQSVEDAYDKTMVALPESQWRNGSHQYGLMRREVAPFWNAVEVWHTGSGFDATVYEFSNKTFPYLEDKSSHMVAIRGTAGGTDFGKDITMIFGRWMGQATDAVNLADEVYRKKDRYKNVYVTGHSLGGYLSQFFFTRSVGNHYGQKSVNGEDDYNYYDKDKHDNSEVKQVFGFNSPRITYNLFQKRLKEYYWLSKYLDKQYDNKYFQVNNDSVVRSYPDAVKFIGSSDGGHRSRSFWEKKFSSVEGFSVGKRDDLSGLGYQETVLKDVRFVHRTIVKVQEDGKEIATIILPKTKSEIESIDKNHLIADIAPHLAIDDSAKLEYGKVNVVKGQPKKIKVTYKFVVSGETNPVATEVVETTYQTDYEAPKVPESKDPSYKYVLQVNPIKKVPVKELTEDKELQITLLKEEVSTDTTVNFKDGDKIVKTVVKKSDASGVAPKLVAEDFPEGYVVPDPLPELKAGSTNDIVVQKKEFTLTFKYLDKANSNAQVGKTDTEKVKYDEDSKYQLAIPDGYELAEGYSFVAPERVKKNEDIDILIQPKAVDTWRLTFVYQHNGETVGNQVATVKRGDNVSLQLPKHSDSSKSYVLADGQVNPYVVTGNRPTSGEQSVDIPVKIKTDATVIDTDTVIHFYQVTLEYVSEGKTVKTQTTRLRQGDSITLDIPTSSSGTYSLADNNDIPAKATKNETIRVNLDFKPNVYPVTLRYVYAKDSDKQVIETENQKIAYGQKPVLKQRIEASLPNSYYQPEKGYEASEIYGPVVVDVPLEYISKTYNVTVEYLENDVLLGKPEIQQVKAGETTSLNPPAATDFDGHYIVQKDFVNPIITSDTVLKVPLVRELNRYKVTINYQYDGETKANTFQWVQSGKSAVDNYKEVISGLDDEALKAELSAYEVEPSFDWNQQITKETTLNVPLKRRSNGEVPAIPSFVLKMIEGMEQTWIKGSNNPAVFKSNGTYDPNIVRVYVDGKELAADNYLAKSGSIMVELKSDYLNTLAVGKHTLGIESKEGLVETDFFILAKPMAELPVAKILPETGINISGLALPIITSLIFGLALQITRRGKGDRSES